MELWGNRKAMWGEFKEWGALDTEQKALAERALLAMEKAERTEKKGKKNDQQKDGPLKADVVKWHLRLCYMALYYCGGFLSPAACWFSAPLLLFLLLVLDSAVHPSQVQLQHTHFRAAPKSLRHPTAHV